MNLSIDAITHILSFGDRLPRYKNVSRTWMQATEQMYPRWKKHLDVEYPFWDRITQTSLQKYYLQKAIYHSDWDSFQVLVDLGWYIGDIDMRGFINIIILQGNWRLAKWVFSRYPEINMYQFQQVYFECMEHPKKMVDIIRDKHRSFQNHICDIFLTPEMAQEIKKYIPSFRETGEPIIRMQMRTNKHRPIISTGPVTPEIAEYMRKQHLIPERTAATNTGIEMYVFADTYGNPEITATTFIAWCQGMHIPVPENALQMKLHERIAYINKHR